MKKIVRKSPEKEIAYELSKKVTQTKLGGGLFPGTDRVKIAMSYQNLRT